jgi:solute:Na+ symporter, SSS family
MGATVIGGGYSIGAVGKSYEWGLLMVLVSMGGYLHFIFSGLIVAPRFREAKLYTVAGYFGHRFDERTRFVVLVLSLLFSVFIVAAQIAAIGSVLSTLLPSVEGGSQAIKYAILIGGAIVIIYSTAGGLLAVIHTDVYQFVILMAGFLLTLGFIAPDVIASWQEVSADVSSSFLEVDGGRGFTFLITTFFAFLLGETFAPGYATRYCIGRTVRDTKIGIAGIGFFLSLVFPLIVFFIALYAKTNFPGIEPQQALPIVIRELHNPFIGGLMIAALLSAVMSSADSALNSATAIFTKDLFEHQFKWGGKSEDADKRILKLARKWTIILGVSATAIAFLWTDIIELLLFTYHIWAPGIILPVVIGATTNERSRSLNLSVFVTMVVSVGATMVYRFTTYAETFDPAVFGVGLSVVIFLLMRAVTRNQR